MKDETPYRVEVEREKACSQCDHGAMYTVVGPDADGSEIAESTAWEDEEMAAMFADAMNRAYALGSISATRKIQEALLTPIKENL